MQSKEKKQQEHNRADDSGKIGSELKAFHHMRFYLIHNLRCKPKNQ